ncbi:hypothetical protein GGI23_005796, partial [Coemansia sp. RSA 2559]
MTFIDELEALIAPSVNCNSYTTPLFNKNILSPSETTLWLDAARVECNPSSSLPTTPSPNVNIYTGVGGMTAGITDNSVGGPNRHNIPLLEKGPTHIPTSGALDSLNDKQQTAGVSKAQTICIQYTEKEKRERKYECEYCKKRFSRPSSLTSHVYTHTGERPFACEFFECTKRFSVLSNLRRHYRVHTNRRQRNGKKRCRGRPLTASDQFVGHGRFGGSYSNDDNNDNSLMESLDNVISNNRFLSGYAPPMSAIENIGSNSNIFYPPFNSSYSTATSTTLQMPLNLYAPSFRATAAPCTSDASLADLCNPPANPGCSVDAGTEVGGFSMPSVSQVSFTERPVVYRGKPVLPSAQTDGEQSVAESPESKDRLSLLSSLATSTANPENG